MFIIIIIIIILLNHIQSYWCFTGTDTVYTTIDIMYTKKPIIFIENNVILFAHCLLCDYYYYHYLFFLHNVTYTNQCFSYY